MGLDQYLTRKIYVPGSTMAIVDCGGKIKLDNIKWVEEEVGYWRKANAIHGWFANLADSDEELLRGMDITMEQLIELRANCKAVLEVKEKGPDILPVVEGCFFGSYEYDIDYLEDLKHTVDIIDAIEKRLITEYDYFVYRASW